MATVNYCPQCGAAIQQAAVFCVTCGHRLGGPATPRSDSSVGDGGQAVATEMRYMIPLRRILFMSIISYGLYFFYWFFLTWKQYRDHTREEVYPVWHALTLTVPIYGQFRTHAHVQVFRKLMTRRGLETTIAPGWAVAVVTVGMVVTGPLDEILGELTQATAIAIAVIDVVFIAIVVWLLRHVQGNLNSYWYHLSSGRLLNARIGVGEVIFAAIGILLWFDTLANLFSAAYRGGL